jgi:hypothetical protein
VAVRRRPKTTHQYAFPIRASGHNLTFVTNDVGSGLGVEPAVVESGPFADLIADAADVQRALDLRVHPIELPGHRDHVHPDGAIPDRALAVVADLDAYGD